MIDTSLIQQLPPIRRARGDRLYGEDERHWVDLWKQGGAWMLGHRPEGAAREWKNQIDKGLGAILPTRWEARLQTHLGELLGSSPTVRVYPHAAAAVQALSAWAGTEFTFQDFRRAQWRPWSAPSVAPRAPWQGVLWPVLPQGPAQAVAVAFGAGLTPPAAPLVAVTEVAALVRAVVTLRRKLGDPQVALALDEVARQWDQRLGPRRLFAREGLWLRPLVEPCDYERLFADFLDAGFVLSPDADQDSLLPWQVSAGEWQALVGAAERFEGGGS